MPITLNDMKESLSKSFVDLLGSSNGLLVERPGKDYGVDLELHEVSVNRYQKSRQRYTRSGRKLDLQLKATTEKYVKSQGAHFTYRLESKNYNDLVQRLNSANPLVLILFVLPQLQNDWIELRPDELIARKHAFWYRPDSKAQIRTTGSKVKIEIPLANCLQIDSFSRAFNNPQLSLS